MGNIQQGVNQLLAMGAIAGKFYADSPEARARQLDIKAEKTEGLETDTKEQAEVAAKTGLELRQQAFNMSPSVKRAQHVAGYEEFDKLAATNAQKRLHELETQRKHEEFVRQFTEGGKYQ